MFLSRHRRIGIDTAIFIYQVEENAKYIDLTQRIFQWLAGRDATAVTSTITMLELLVHPYRRDDSELADSVFALLSTYPHLEWLPLSLTIADRAAQLRAEHNLRTPDAVQAASALAGRATGFVSNDSIYRRIGALDVLILDELLEAH